MNWSVKIHCLVRFVIVTMCKTNIEGNGDEKIQSSFVQFCTYKLLVRKKGLSRVVLSNDIPTCNERVTVLICGIILTTCKLVRIPSFADDFFVFVLICAHHA